MNTSAQQEAPRNTPVNELSYTDASRELESVRGHIESRYGKDFVPETPNQYKSGKQAQGAHEAIRPTAVERDPESIARYLDKDALALYTLIYNRFVSSQMTPAVYDRTTVDA